MDYGKSNIHKVAEKMQQCRDIVREIEKFGVDDLQRMQIIYLLSLGLEQREALENVTQAIKPYIGNPLEEAEKQKLEV
jgi:hypothetical protein